MDPQDRKGREGRTDRTDRTDHGAPEPFADRHDAGRRLADRVAGLGLRDPVVLGLPRGGVPVAREVADRLGVPVEVFVARKIAIPGFPEVGMAAIAEGLDEVVISPQAVELGFAPAQLADLAGPERLELVRRIAAYRGERALPDMAGREVLLVDDGLATGVTAQAALRSLGRWGPRRLVFAAPACAPEGADCLTGLADEIVCLLRPATFEAVGEWYEDFEQLEDAEVVALLKGAHPEAGGGWGAGGPRS
jgi:putative phosphoribosyl transferase